MGLFPAMGAALVLTMLLSSRTEDASGLVTDRVFPVISRVHLPGAGTFVPGTFAVCFYAPAIAGMVVLNVLLSRRLRPLGVGGVKLFYYVFVVLVAIVEVAADTLIPILHLPEWQFRAAVGAVDAIFIAAAALAMVASSGADREW